MSDPLAELAKADRVALRARFEAGHPVRPGDLAGLEYDGVALGTPAWVRRLSWTKFKKVFAVDAAGRLHGWNQACVQDPLDRPWTDRLRRGRPIGYGPFVLVDHDAAAWPAGHDRGCFIDYRPLNTRLGPMGWAVDPLVSLEAGKSELLLGYTALVIGGRARPTPTWFVLRRGRALEG